MPAVKGHAAAGRHRAQLIEASDDEIVAMKAQ